MNRFQCLWCPSNVLEDDVMEKRRNQSGFISTGVLIYWWGDKNQHEFGYTLGVGDGQGGWHAAVHGVAESDMTEWTELRQVGGNGTNDGLKVEALHRWGKEHKWTRWNRPTAMYFLWAKHCALELPRWRSGKESACQCRRCRFDPWIK